MAQWERDFRAYSIHHTRSHVNLHPDPFDFQSLKVWAKMQHRTAELCHMELIDREDSRAVGYRGPFELVGTQLFNDFCQSLVTRYGLQPIVQQGSVEDIQIVPPPPDASEVHQSQFALHLVPACQRGSPQGVVVSPQGAVISPQGAVISPQGAVISPKARDSHFTTRGGHFTTRGSCFTTKGSRFTTRGGYFTTRGFLCVTKESIPQYPD
jgi:hypothetical protein